MQAPLSVVSPAYLACWDFDPSSGLSTVCQRQVMKPVQLDLLSRYDCISISFTRSAGPMASSDMVWILLGGRRYVFVFVVKKKNGLRGSFPCLVLTKFQRSFIC